MTIRGYARCSTNEDIQDTQRQEDALNKYGCEVLYIEYASGKNMNREKLQEMLKDLQANDEVVVCELSRISRSTKDLIDIADKFNEQGVNLVSLTESIDTKTPMGRMFYTVLAAVAQCEREQTSMRVKDGLKAARRKGVKMGRPKADKRQIERAVELYNEGNLTIKEIEAATGISKSTFYKHLNDRKNQRRAD